MEERRKRGDLIQAYRVLNRVDAVDPSLWFTLEQPRQGALSTRQNRGFKNVQKQEANIDLRRNFWSVRVVDQWNGLPDSVKECETVDYFKNSIDNLRKK